jgi:flagellar hook protein FlgE
MFQSFFTGLSGLFSFSRNLDNVSNNIANLNTPGFKGSDSFYSSLTSGGNPIGTQISGEQARLTQGEIRQTGNPGDLAISGNGFFILQQDGQTQYTRAGQFQFNDEGFLVDPASGAQVAAVNESGELEPINIDNFRVLAPEATSQVNFSGNLSSDQAVETISGITVFNGLGEEVSLNFEFTNNGATTPGSWNLVVTDDEGNTLATEEIRFNADGTPAQDFNELTLELTDSNGGVDAVRFSFGEPGSFANTTSVSGGDSSSVQATVVDGFEIGSLTSIDFDQRGQLQLNYSNGQSLDGPTLALATFTNESTLSIASGSRFEAADISTRSIGIAGDPGFGGIVSESIELSNVDLSREFADMIIIQRGFQASSRILNVSNELLDQLYENTRS